jgi:hypothetical protein
LYSTCNGRIPYFSPVSLYFLFIQQIGISKFYSGQPLVKLVYWNISKCLDEKTPDHIIIRPILGGQLFVSFLLICILIFLPATFLEIRILKWEAFRTIHIITLPEYGSLSPLLLEFV